MNGLPKTWDTNDGWHIDDSGQSGYNLTTGEYFGDANHLPKVSIVGGVAVDSYANITKKMGLKLHVPEKKVPKTELELAREELATLITSPEYITETEEWNKLADRSGDSYQPPLGTLAKREIALRKRISKLESSDK